MTRLALLGGLYSNDRALAAALHDIARRGVDATYCLGDLGAFGPHPDRVYPLLRDTGVLCIQGNYDNSLAGGLADCQCGYTDPRDNHFARLSYLYTFRHTSDDNKAWLGTLPLRRHLEVDGRRVLLCHGSPRKINEFLWESTSPDQFLSHLLDSADADIACVTHTGIKWHRALPDNRHVVNVGVLGRPENDGTTAVWYTLLTVDRGRVTVEFVPVAYDHQALAADMQAEGLPAAFIETILTGWWTTCLEVLPHRERTRGRF
ncbi:MAG TPA: metallophosphoesterase family protein [Vicinamibacterales bacterium]|nr:metallophosphoesterase family protein [Vicinamibacterales bacterium]